MTEKMSGILCTSLIPNNFALQHKAVSSWHDAGFGVISVNCKEEISQLNGEFIDVDFIKVDRDAREKHGKPLVYLDDALAALKTTKASIHGIINADIILRAPGLSGKLENIIEGQCFFANRTDVHVIKDVDMDGSYYKLGYDLFLFDPLLSTRIPVNDFCLGMPWWDYWLPVAALLTGFAPVYLDSHIAFHQTHIVNYENDAFYEYGIQMRNLLIKCFDNDQGDVFKQQLGNFILVYFKDNKKIMQNALRALDVSHHHNDRSILPPFAEALCAFIKHYSNTCYLEGVEDFV